MSVPVIIWGIVFFLRMKMLSYLLNIRPQLHQSFQNEAIRSSKLRNWSCWSISVYSKSVNLRVWRDKSHMFLRYCFLAWYALEYSPYNTLYLIIDIVKASRLIFIPSVQIFCLQHAIVFEICEIHFWYRNKISVLPSFIPVTVTYSEISCLNGYTRLKKA